MRGAEAGVEWADRFRPSDMEHRNPIMGGRKAVQSNPRLFDVVRPARPGVEGTVTEGGPRRIDALRSAA